MTETPSTGKRITGAFILVLGGLAVFIGVLLLIASVVMVVTSETKPAGLVAFLVSAAVAGGGLYLCRIGRRMWKQAPSTRADGGVPLTVTSSPSNESGWRRVRQEFTGDMGENWSRKKQARAEKEVERQKAEAEISALADGGTLWRAAYIHGHPMIAAAQDVIVAFRSTYLDLAHPKTAIVLGRIDLRSLTRTDVQVVPEGAATTSDVLLGGMVAGHKGGAIADLAASVNLLASAFDRDKIFVHLALQTTDGFGYTVVLESKDGQALGTRINRERVNLAGT